MFNPITGWYPASIKPVRKGAYLVRTHDGDDPCLLFWSGLEWGYPDGVPAMQSLCVEWCGLSFDPSDAKHAEADYLDDRGMLMRRAPGYFIEMPR